jgi:mannitol-specific phosphotransferase system IIBC component
MVAENIAGNVRFSFLAVAGNVGPALGVLAPFIITELAAGQGQSTAASLVAVLGGVVAAISIAFSPPDRVAQPLH